MVKAKYEDFMLEGIQRFILSVYIVVSVGKINKLKVRTRALLIAYHRTVMLFSAKLGRRDH